MNLKEKLKFRDDERGVSPVIGVIMMIAIVVIIAAVVAAFAYGIIGGVSKAPSAALVVEGASSDSEKLKVIHHGGDTIVDAFGERTGSHDNGSWKNIELRKNGKVCELEYSELNGATNWDPGTGKYLPFGAGDELKLVFNASTSKKLVTGDSIVILYKQTGDILQRTTVT